MNRNNCRHCNQPIILAQVRGGRWLPFDIETIEATPDAIDAYVPLRSGAMVPVSDVADRHLANARRYAHQHRCAQFMHAVAEKRYGVPTFASGIGELIDLWTEAT